MPRELTVPITYLVTSGETTDATTPSSADFLALLALVERAAAARVTLVQLREKALSARTLSARRRKLAKELGMGKQLAEWRAERKQHVG